MGHIEKTVFISYRRMNLPWALAIYQNLTSKGYDVFFDYQNINSGDFEQIILGNIRARAHFLVLLTPSALERCNDTGDWLRLEIETALDEKRNVVPLFLDGFNFDAPYVAKYLNGKLTLLKSYGGLDVPAGYFDEAMARLRSRYLNIQLDAVLHPLSNKAKIASLRQQDAANQASTISQQDLSASQNILFKSVALGFDESYVFLFDLNNFWLNKADESLKQKLNELYNLGRELQSIALGPDGNYVLLFEDNGCWYHNIPESLIRKLQEWYYEGYIFKSVALGPDGSYVLLLEGNGYWHENIPESLVNKMQEWYSQGYIFKSVSLGPNGSYVLLLKGNWYWYENIPENLINKMQEWYSQGYIFKSVSLGSNGSYVLLLEGNGYWYENIPENLINKMLEIYRKGFEI